MSDLTKATLVIEHAFVFPGGTRAAVRVIPHDHEGRKPRGRAGKGTLIVGYKDETFADVLRTVAGYYDQEGSWEAFTQERINELAGKDEQ